MQLDERGEQPVAAPRLVPVQRFAVQVPAAEAEEGGGSGNCGGVDVGAANEHTRSAG